MEPNRTNDVQNTYAQPVSGQVSMEGQSPVYSGQPVNGQMMMEGQSPVYTGQAQMNGQFLNGNPEVQKKSGKGKKVGYFFLSLTPFAACMVIQVVMALLVGVVVGVVEMVQFMAQNPAASQSEAMNVYMQAVTANMGVMMLATHVALTVTSGLWYYFGCGRPKLKASVKNVNVKAIVLAVAGGLTMCFLANGMVGVEMYIIPDIYQNYLELVEAAGFGVDTLTIIASVLLAPIGEELICRGLTIYYAKKVFSKFFIVNILQALLFGVMHGNFIQGSYAFIIGLFLGYLAEKTHSLLPCMLLHFVVNFSSTFIMESIFAEIPEALWIYAIIYVVSIAVTLLLVWWGGSVKKREAF